MKIKKILLLLAIGIFSLLLNNSIAPWCPAQEQAKFKPLFPVRLEHEFPQSKKTFEEVKNLILKKYYTDDINEETLYWAAIQGMLRHISPPDNPELSKIWTPEEYTKIEQALKGVQVSIGIKSSFNPQEGSLAVTEVLPNSPAESILEPFDRIMRIDSQPLKGKTIDEVNLLLTGDEGTKVKFTVNRDIKVFEVTIQRREFETQSLIVTRLSDNIALIELKKFTADVSLKLRGKLEELRNEGFKALIIDLRNNSGGVLAEALRVVELFLPEKSILMRTVQREKNLQNYVSVNKDPFVFDLAVLVNPDTASSAEVVASSLQDHQKALIIGASTYGKGVFEKTITLKNNFRVKFISGAMYSPKGNTWQSKGVTPDFLVEQDEKTVAALFKIEPRERLSKDVAMITAYKVLKRL